MLMRSMIDERRPDYYAAQSEFAYKWETEFVIAI